MLEQALLAEKEGLEEEKRVLRNQISEAENRIHQIDQRLVLVHGLLNPDNYVATSAKVNGTQPMASCVDIALEILSERDGETMYYKELAAEVARRGGDISGENAAQILVARLVKDERFVRPVRKGFYALRIDYPNARNVGERKSSTRARNRRNNRIN